MTEAINRLPNHIKRIIDDISDAAHTGLDAPSTAETPADLHERLLVTRAGMTRVSELLGELTLLTGRIRAALVDRKGALEDEESTVVTPRGHRVLTEDYSSAKERNARLAGATLEARRRVRQVEKVLADADAALTYGRDRHRELDRAVRDIDTRLRILSFEPNSS
jgi:hypothetical protein